MPSSSCADTVALPETLVGDDLNQPGCREPLSVEGFSPVACC